MTEKDFLQHYTQHYKDVQRILKPLVTTRWQHDPFALDELTQTAWSTGWEKLDTFRGTTPKELIAWVVQIGVRTFLMEYRRTRARSRLAVLVPLEEGVEVGTNPLEVVEAHIDFDRLMARLPEAVVAILVAGVLDEESLTERCKRLGISRRTEFDHRRRFMDRIREKYLPKKGGVASI